MKAAEIETKEQSQNTTVKVYLQVTGAYVLWGILPVYWKGLKHVPSIDVLTHRIVWCAVWIAVYVIVIQKKNIWKNVVNSWKENGIVPYLMSAGIVAVNWLAYVYAVQNNHILQASLGYYICPIIIVLIGIFLFRESMSKLKGIALLFCTAGVVYSSFSVEGIPWLSLLIALSFALYGMIKKRIAGNPLTALFSDTLLLSPLGAAHMIYKFSIGESYFFSSYSVEPFITSSLLAGAGIVTLVPLVLFIGGAIKIPYNAIGFMQFITPTMTFIIGIWIYNESFTVHDAIVFSCIWAGVSAYVLSLVRTKEYRK
ncbi:MAG: EamA family transporter RarD [Spirochaetia bacterium]|nr:EamA family transporter RarD [Spirochaetia bacterium]MCF7946568.1 EamA family transporter RarD [Spirochaetia bacterium]MCF7952912.1 EamA family transporter RarD [Spirochaetales bacterium]